MSEAVAIYFAFGAVIFVLSWFELKFHQAFGIAVFWPVVLLVIAAKGAWEVCFER